MLSLTEAVVAGADPDELRRRSVPDTYLAAHLRKEDVGIFTGVEDKDVRKSLHVGMVPMPELAPDEVLVAVMASSVNYNSVWSAMFEPLPTFTFLERYGREGGHAARHDLPHHVIGSDASGVVVRVGAGTRRWQVGDHVVVSPLQVDDQEPMTHADGVLGGGQRAWGFETNFGGLAHYTVVRASQLLPKPAHLTWEEAAVNLLTAGTAYRMLISERGARIKLGDVVLIWGAAGGLGAYAVQLVKNAGGIPVGVVGSEEKAELVRALGCDVVVNRAEIGMGDGTAAEDQIALGKRLGRIIRRETGEDPHVAFDFVGRATFGISVFVVRRGGTVVTCGSSTGYQHQYDNRYLWMNLKRIVGSHAANLQEMAECNRLFGLGKLVPVLSDVFPLEEAGEAVRLVQRNRHVGKVGVLCLAPHGGLGVTDPELRARIGEKRLNPLRKPALSTARNSGPE
ncbi:crotonyl-CoA carboxylase/reductase [Streptomyces griseiscabiei]|uniref:Crotonyl-CoA carboxylase/reductase n=1 Tax=Streptomyces griseiscabiei TaxID=2993540 RepID=A0ABU4L2M4_9ACTN|nr:crotonyl-CoA carboxylase/reductase [Streptomyces griseiscabiei]MBZ3906081.1 crotonyl-CoA carboxylase/reductase [Streptomyces griseiscabiei]MDX2909715.1 crotonyl-CoA carboxylase/reductase [Streptomyces griseiscabiei]